MNTYSVFIGWNRPIPPVTAMKTDYQQGAAQYVIWEYIILYIPQESIIVVGGLIDFRLDKNSRAQRVDMLNLRSLLSTFAL